MGSSPFSPLTPTGENGVRSRDRATEEDRGPEGGNEKGGRGAGTFLLAGALAVAVAAGGTTVISAGLSGAGRSATGGARSQSSTDRE